MKKAKFSLVLSGVLFFLLVGIQGVSAQSVSMDDGSALSSKDTYVGDVNLVDNGDAMNILTNAIKTMDYGNSVNEEANASARVSYYQLLLNELEGGSSIDEALPASNYDLYVIVNRFSCDMGLDQQVIYDETVGLLSQ